MKQDIYGHEKRYKNWKEEVLEYGEKLTKSNSDILLQFIFDMEIGANTSNTSKKGARSYHRLNCVKQKLIQIFRMLEGRGIKDVTHVTEKQLQSFFDDMRKGVIKTAKGGKYKSTADYVKGFKSFHHWRMKVNRKKGKVIPDITEDLDSSREEKPVWVYLDDKQMSKLLKNTAIRYAPFLEFLYCSVIRPQEAFSLYGRDITEEKGEVYADISREISKSIGRKIKLKMCGENVLKHMKENKIGEDDLLFQLSAPMINRYLNGLGKELFGEGISKGGEKYSKLTMYDFRHNSCCFWLPRYKTISTLMYRFGWKSERYVSYYSEFWGMKDPIRDEDMYVDITKTELEKEIEKLHGAQNRMKKENELIKIMLENLYETMKEDGYDFNIAMEDIPIIEEGKK